jgi:hypothetical protein
MFSRRVESNSANFIVLVFSSSILEIGKESMFLEDHTNLVTVVIVSNINTFVITTSNMIGHFSILVESSDVITIRTITMTPKYSL